VIAPEDAEPESRRGGGDLGHHSITVEANRFESRDVVLVISDAAATRDSASHQSALTIRLPVQSRPLSLRYTRRQCGPTLFDIAEPIPVQANAA
jgi:hypothetical protein